MREHTITLRIDNVIAHAGIMDECTFSRRPSICLDCGESLPPGTPYGLVVTDRGNFHLCRKCTHALQQERRPA